jgi:hypothetical protein
MYRGKIIDILPAEAATKEKVGLLMAGVTQPVAEARELPQPSATQE